MAERSSMQGAREGGGDVTWRWVELFHTMGKLFPRRRHSPAAVDAHLAARFQAAGRAAGCAGDAQGSACHIPPGRRALCESQPERTWW